VKARDFEGQQALDCAVYFGYTKLARLLLEKGSEVNNIDTDGATAVFWAFRRYHAEHEAMVRLLLQYGVDVSVRDKTGKTVLHWAARGEHATLVSILLENGAGIVDAKDNSETAQH
jgi:ankyrin repeat protein